VHARIRGFFDVCNDFIPACSGDEKKQKDDNCRCGILIFHLIYTESEELHNRNQQRVDQLVGNSSHCWRRLVLQRAGPNSVWQGLRVKIGSMENSFSPYLDATLLPFGGSLLRDPRRYYENATLKKHGISNSVLSSMK
jgi:hypothetical protein